MVSTESEHNNTIEYPAGYDSDEPKVKVKGARFNAHVNSYYFSMEHDFLGKVWGNQGYVVRAYKHKDLKRPYALKVIKREKLKCDKMKRWLGREIRI
jgi:hypothetical protein